jgi:hypothetical protein
MSSAVLSTTAALGRPFIFDADADSVHGGTAALGCPVERSSTAMHRQIVQSTIKNQQSKILPGSIIPASRLEIRPTPEMVSSGIPAIDNLTGGLPRGCLTEICGSTSSGRTTVLLAGLAAATRRGEFCALIDASDSLDPHSAAAAGVDLDRLLWVRCGESSPQSSAQGHRMRSRNSNPAEYRLEQVLRVTDLLLESGGFGLIVLDLADLPSHDARRIPLTTWFRFRRAVEHKPTILLAIEHHPIAGSCSSLLLQLAAAKACPEPVEGWRRDAAHGASRGLGAEDVQAPEGRKKIGYIFGETPSESPSHAHLLTGLEINAELIRSRLDRKPARSVTFAAKTAWAG